MRWGIWKHSNHVWVTCKFLCQINGAASDLEDAFSQDEALRRALAQQIRMVCMDVGFFYGSPVFLQHPAHAS